MSTAPYDYTALQLDALEAAARSWERTPFCNNSAVKGAGVSCQHLVSELYFEAQWLPRFDVPNGPLQIGRAGNTPLMEEFLDKSPHFVDVDPERIVQSDWRRGMSEIVRPGCLVISRPARLPHHAAIALRNGAFVHAVIGMGVQIPPQLPDAWAKRLWRVYRPLC